MKLLLATTVQNSTDLIKGQGAFFKQNGYQVIYSSTKGKKANKLTKSEGLIFEPVDFSREINITKDIKSLFQCIRIIRRHRPDIVNAGTPKAGLLFMLAAWICRTKVKVFTLRGIRSSSLLGMKRRVVQMTERLSCRFADKVIAISPSLKQEAIELNLVNNSSKIVVIGKGSSNGIDLNRFSVTPSIKKRVQLLKQDYNIDKETFIFGFIGRIVKDKGIEELLDAFKNLVINNPKNAVKLLLIGGYEEGNSISNSHKNEIKNNPNIISVGFSKEIPEFAYLMDVLILPSYREGFGNVVMEAAAMETPAIVTNVPGAKDTIVDMVTGFLINPQSASDLEEKMMFYLKNPELVEKHGTNARKRIEKFFKNEKIWLGQKQIYEEVIKK